MTILNQIVATSTMVSLITLFTSEMIFKLFGINALSLKVIGGVILTSVSLKPPKEKNLKLFFLLYYFFK